jgi:hypothetical protein
VAFDTKNASTIAEGVAGIAGVTPAEYVTAGRCSITTLVLVVAHITSTHTPAASA